MGQYLGRGIPLVWVVDSEVRTVTVHRPNELPQVIEEPHELMGNGVLADFRRWPDTAGLENDLRFQRLFASRQIR